MLLMAMGYAASEFEFRDGALRIRRRPCFRHRSGRASAPSYFTGGVQTNISEACYTQLRPRSSSRRRG